MIRHTAIFKENGNIADHQGRIVTFSYKRTYVGPTPKPPTFELTMIDCSPRPATHHYNGFGIEPSSAPWQGFMSSPDHQGNRTFIPGSDKITH